MKDSRVSNKKLLGLGVMSDVGKYVEGYYN